ncbi:hypothetical protein KEM48_013027 [Puccinia striiformis f. sp. tritici PST-130]|uniref:Clathrin light chain n=1 Tax=Puccinia striiformis f. sp. tritici PST-78 TaxID=1165861 RepID=A0A0L0VV78_9BASI|nr:hypothetical protein KEM48_013027 [Puccinia striiformis f. sp. tritici PST-130]KNF03204.1 hypothetical protein PSTG_03791 [Puccinia striiformis f. sp. tritici PST-78]
MSHFPELEHFSNALTSNDPQADFIARERALQGDEFGPTPDNYQETRQQQQVSQNEEDQFRLGDFDSSPIDHFNIPAPNLTGAPDELASVPDQYADISVMMSFPIRPEWRTKQAEEIRPRDQRSIAKREETIAAAEAIDDFYHGYNTEKQKNIAKNKEEEAEFLQTRNDKLGHYNLGKDIRSDQTTRFQIQNL